MTAKSVLAIFGNSPHFDRKIACHQNFWPTREEYRAIFSDIFERQYYAHHGPLVQALEQALAQHLKVRHAISVTNEFIGLTMLAQALDVQGPVLVPAYCSIKTVQSLDWAQATPLFCDVSPESGMLDAERVAPVLEKHKVSAILGVNAWGGVCDLDGLTQLARSAGLPFYLDSSQGFGSVVNGKALGGFGHAEVLSFHSENILNAGEGGVVCTQDDALAARVRNIRSSYGMGPAVPVKKTGNGRVSEAQAALALHGLKRLPEYLAHNRRIRSFYAAGLKDIPGISLYEAPGVNPGNDQNLIIQVSSRQFGLDRDELCQLLHAENILAEKGYFTKPGLTPCSLYEEPIEKYPNARQFGNGVLELPMYRGLDQSAVSFITEAIQLAHRHSGEIREVLRPAA
jgi:dTDP-4-amino-4,6-dideoxygalactose transaminase